MAGIPKPRLSQRAKEGLVRLRHNTDFTVYRDHLVDELEYCKHQLVNEVDQTAFAQIQGRARLLQDLLKHIQTGEE